MSKKFNNEVAENPELNEREELEEDEYKEAEEDGDPTLPWSVNQENESNEMDVSDNEYILNDDLESDISTDSICASKIIKHTPKKLKENLQLEELTIDQNIVIDGVEWKTSSLYIEQGYSISAVNGGSLYVILENGQLIKVIGENHNSFCAVNHDIIMG